MLPRPAMNDLADGPARHAIARCNLSSGTAVTNQSPDSRDVLLGELGGMMSVTTLNSPLAHSVGKVLTMRCEEEVVRSEAWWIVASMGDLHAGRDWPIRDNPHAAVGIPHPSVKPELPIPQRGTSSSPHPALSAAVDVGVQFFLKGDRLMRHRRLPQRLGAGSVLNSPTPSLYPVIHRG